MPHMWSRRSALTHSFTPLLLSPIQAQTTRIRSPSPPRLKIKKRSQTRRDQPEGNDDDDDQTTTRRTRAPRVASSGRTSYNERELQQQGAKARAAPPAREGVRKSRRLNSGRSSNGRYNEDASSGDDDSSYYRSRPLLNKLRNPTGPQPDSDAEDAGSDRMADEIDDEEGYWISGIRVDRRTMPLPRRESLPDEMGGQSDLIFEDKWSHFRPNLTPEQVLRGGAFGGGFFRDHYSTVLHRQLDSEEDIASLPPEWTRGLDHLTYLSNPDYNPSLNRYSRKAGQSLTDWEKAGWIAKIDPRGWFQWYIRFYNGRRCSDDERQVSRWLKACGPAGRFKRSVVTQVAKAYGVDRAQNGVGWDDIDVSPVIRQVCWQWAYELNQRDYLAYLPEK